MMFPQTLPLIQLSFQANLDFEGVGLVSAPLLLLFLSRSEGRLRPSLDCP